MHNEINNQYQPRELFIEELEQVAGGLLIRRPEPIMTTMAVGEEDGGGGGGIYTTMALGEEDGGGCSFGFFK